MELEPSPAFNRDLRRVRDRKLQQRIARKIEELEAASTISEISGVQSVTCLGSHYRIKIGDYRLAIALEGSVVMLIRFLHRGEIYRHFP